MPSKKKKYNARFPPARIKKIMQMDDEVGKVAQAVPVIISRTLELFVESLLKKAEVVTVARNAKTLTPSHLKQCILAEQRFDFLKDLVENIPDSQGDEDCTTPAADTPRSSTSNTPFVFPVVNRGQGASSSSTARSLSVTTTSSPVIKEAPPVNVANNDQSYGLPPVPSFYQSQPEQYDPVIVQPHPSSMHNFNNALGNASNINMYIPPHSNANAQIHPTFQQPPVTSVNPPLLSHFEYLPNNLHYTPITANSNNGMNFSLHQRQDSSDSAPNNGPGTGVIVSPSGTTGFYQRQPSLQ